MARKMRASSNLAFIRLIFCGFLAFIHKLVKLNLVTSIAQPLHEVVEVPLLIFEAAQGVLAVGIKGRVATAAM